MRNLLGRSVVSARSPSLRAIPKAPCRPSRSLLRCLAAGGLIGAALALPARAYDLHYRQNGTSVSPSSSGAFICCWMPTPTRI